MKLFLALAFVAVAAALPEPVRLPKPVLPQVVKKNDQVDAVRVVDAPLSEVAPVKLPAPVQLEEARNDADVAPQVQEVQVDAVRFVDAVQPVAAEEALIQTEVAAAEEIPADAVKFVDGPLEEVAPQAEEVAPAAEEIPADAVKFVEAPFEEVAPQAEEVKVDAVRFVDTPVEEEIKIAREPEYVVPAPVILSAASLPVVHQGIQVDAVRIVDSPQVPVMPLQPFISFVDASPLIVPQQIMDLILAGEEAQFVHAAEQELPRPVKIFADPMLR